MSTRLSNAGASWTRCALALVLFLGSPLIQRAQAQGEAPTKTYGVIEIGSKGVKGYTFELDRAETDPSCSAEDDTYLRCLDVKILPQANVGALEERSVGRASEAVKDFYTKMGTANHIAPERIFIVGSSSIARIEHKDTLVAAIKRLLGRNVGVDFVSVDQEAAFNFEGVLGMLPQRWRKLRQYQAAVIDIGSGNVKASFLTEQAGSRKLVTFGVNFGTKRATDEINQNRESAEFKPAADRWRSRVFVPELREQLDNNPGLGNRNRVYLIGGIVWAMVNLTRPDNTGKFPVIYPASIDGFLASLSNPAAATALCSDDRKGRYKEIRKACDTFSANNLVAGSEILKGISDELGFVRGRKKLFFFKDSLYAWPLGYLRNKVYGTENP